MTDPLFDSRTARFDLPLLFAGQAQKEHSVNELAAMVDALLHIAVESRASAPPPAPIEGQCWLVDTSPSGTWTGKAGMIACWSNGSWIFLPARDGLRVLNRSSGQDLRFAGSWQAPPRPSAPTGGSIVDAESRNAINMLIAALTTAGIIPSA